MTTAENGKSASVTEEIAPDSELPEGWTFASVGDLAQITSGKYIRRDAYHQTPIQPYPVAGAGGPIGWTDKANFKPPIMTLGRVGAAGALNVYRTGAWVTDNALVVEPRLCELFDLLSLFFGTVRWTEIHTGSSQPLITQTLVKSLSIPLPPLAEQERIAAQVEKLLAQVNAARARLTKVPAILKRFRQSVLAAACSGRLTADWRDQNRPGAVEVERLVGRLREQRCGSLRTQVGGSETEWYEPSFETGGERELPQYWEYVALGNLGTWTAGGTPSKSEDRFWNYGTIPWLSPKDMKSERIQDTQDHITEQALSETSIKLMPENSLLFVVRGMILAHTFPVALNTRPLTINQDIRAITPYDGVLPDYLLRALQAESFLILFAVRESTHGTRRLESETLRRWPIPIPTPQEEAEIIRRVEALFKLADAIENRVDATNARVEKLTRAILAKAFRGVPTEAEIARREGRSYESAAALLTRIRAERPPAETTPISHRQDRPVRSRRLSHRSR